MNKEIVSAAIANGDSTNPIQASVVETTDPLVNAVVVGNPDGSNIVPENHICTDNTTTTPLGAGETFTGDWQDCLQYQEVNISVDTDKDSAEDGLVIQWSADGVNIGDTDSFSVYANSGTNYTPNPAFRYVRVVYTNGSQAQTRFSLMTILRRGATGGSFHKIDGPLKDNNDGRLNVSVIKLKKENNNYVSGKATNDGNMKVSLEEFGIDNPLPEYVSGNIDTTDATYYYFLSFIPGTTNWRIKRLNKSTYVAGYATGDSNITTAWTNRATHTYLISY